MILVGWLIFSVILGLIGKGGGSMPLINTVILTIGYAAFMLTIGRGLLNRILPWVNKKLAWPGGVLSISLALCFLAAAFTEYIGIHAIFGAFIMGVALGDSEHFSERAKEIVHQFINNIFAPLFFVSIGLRVNFIVNFDSRADIGNSRDCVCRKNYWKWSWAPGWVDLAGKNRLPQDLV